MNRYKKIQYNNNTIALQQQQHSMNNEDHNTAYHYHERRQQQHQQPRSYWYMSFIAICTWILVFILNHILTQQQRYIPNDNIQTMSLLLTDCEKVSNHTTTTTRTTTEVDINSGTNTTTTNINTTTTLPLYESKLLHCNNEYQFMKQYQTPNGLSYIDYQRSRAYYGNPIKLYNLIQKLKTGHAANVVLCGGSITLGHGIEPKSARYGDILQNWLNQTFPLVSTDPNIQPKHNVHIKGGHGADMCAMSKRMKQMYIPDNPDLFILEFAVNDYQGQDHEIYVDSKTDVFYDGYERIALCCEIVVSYLIRNYPTTPIVFLEFQTVILNRKNAQLLHTGVAQHYQIPIISYGDVMLTHYYQLIHQLNESSYYTTTNDNSILPYPHGCKLDCNISQMYPTFRETGCMSVCHFMEASGMSCPIKEHYGDRKPCNLHYLAHDAVHPSVTGHQLALDMIIEMFATTIRDVCLDNIHNNDNDDQTNEVTYNQQKLLSYEHIIPPEQYGWLASSNILKRYSDFVLVQDTLYTFAQQNELLSYNYSNSFRLYGDGGADRKGWISTNPNGNEYIEFVIQLPMNICYVIYISILKSYNNMGIMTIELINLHNNDNNNNTRSMIVDGLWKPHISVPNDVQLNDDNDIYACTGKCLVRITTHPIRSTQNNITDGNIGNKVKITSLSARHCIS